ncbi:MAG: hypothetical protein M3M89_06090 [Thermoproteota archaeon]|nr:hypothetical protein [Thermoproteota archaeon]
MSEYSALAAKRYRQYMWQKQKESLMHGLVTLVLRILHSLIRTLQQAGIKKAQRVEKINVEREESKR